MSGTKSSAIKHGTLTGYQQFHCRCDLCKEAHRSYDRNRKEEDRSLAHHTKMGPWSARERNYVAETMDLPIRTVADHLKHPCANISGMRYTIRLEALERSTVDGPENEKTHWTNEELQALRIMFERGDSDHKMAHLLGRSLRAVQLKRLDLGLKRTIY